MHHSGLAVLVCVAFTVSACNVPSAEVYQVTGIIEGIDRPSGHVKIAHEDIEGFMPAMTMNFEVARDALLEGIEPGMEVRFKLERSGTELRILELEVTDASGARPGGVGGLGAPLDEAPGFELVDHDGQPFALSNLRGSAVLLDFIFTRCPGPCPIQTSAHVALQRALPDDVTERTWFVSVTLDPEYDTPELLRAYAEKRNARLDRWRFLTGSTESVNQVLRDYHIGTARLPDGTVDHLIITYLIDPEGQIARRYLGSSTEEKDIVRDLREVLG